MVFAFAWQKLTVDDRTFAPCKSDASYTYLHNAKTEKKKKGAKWEDDIPRHFNHPPLEKVFVELTCVGLIYVMREMFL